jgi:nucleotide-binding universal stress UspA family protein
VHLTLVPGPERGIALFSYIAALHLVAARMTADDGNPFAEIVRLADEIQADAVIVGASTKAGHRFVGSLAVHLVRASRWPVTFVP